MGHYHQCPTACIGHCGRYQQLQLIHADTQYGLLFPCAYPVQCHYLLAVDNDTIYYAISFLFFTYRICRNRNYTYRCYTQLECGNRFY